MFHLSDQLNEGELRLPIPPCKLVKKSSLPLVKIKIFQKLLKIVQITVHQDKQTHLLLILIPNSGKNRVKSKRVLIKRTTSGTFWEIAESAMYYTNFMFSF